MIGPVLLLLSWVLLRAEGRGLSALGIDHPRRRVSEFGLGFAVMGSIVAVQQLALSAAASDPFVSNPDVTTRGLLNGIRFTVNSVLYEELLFRGYLLYRASRWIGTRRATLLSAAAFGIYHWFSYGAFGNPVAMAYIFVLTGAFGYTWARAFVVTGSVAAPIGLHLGWNAIAYLIFSAGPLGAGVMVPASGVRQLSVAGWPSLALNVILPIATTVGVLAYLRRLERSVANRAVTPDLARSTV